MSAAAERSRSRVVDRGCQRTAHRARARRRAVTRSCRDGADAAGRRGDERRSRRHDLHHRVRKAVDVARIIVHRGSDGDVGGGQQRRNDVVRNDTEKLHAVAHAGSLRPGPKRCVEIAVSRDGDAQLRLLRFQRGSGVDQIFESLFLDETADGEDQRYIIRDAEQFSAARPRVRARA